MKDNKYVKEEVLPELGNEKLGDAVAKKLEFYDGTDWVEINAGGISGKAHEISVTPDQSSPGKVISLVENPTIPGKGYVVIPGGLEGDKPIATDCKVGMLRYTT
jgi:hypothetical protein